MERDAVVVRASMQSFEEQVKQHEAFLTKYEMGARNLRLELEEERTKANQHTIEKIGFLARDIQRAKVCVCVCVCVLCFRDVSKSTIVWSFPLCLPA